MASNKIKGITIEIGGDTSKLGKAIEHSEKQTRSLQVELKQVERLLKFDPGNTELLAQKQKILTDSVEETSKKLEILKEAHEQVVEQYKRGEIGEDQMRAFQREVIQTEKKLEDMQKELKTTNQQLENVGKNDGIKKQSMSAEEAQEKINDMNDTIAKSAKVIGSGIVALGGSLVAGAGYALKVTTDFDHALNTLATRTGATKNEMVGLETSMENIYKNNFGESIEDVAQAMATAKNNTKAMGAELEEVTSNALLLRDTFEFDVNESTRTAKMLMDQFGISGKDAYNLIAQGAQKGLDKNGDLLDTINEYAVHYKQLGYTSEEFFNSLVNGASEGTFSVDKLGDAMKEFGIRSKDTAKATTEGFELIGLNADEMRNKFAQGGATAKKATEETMKALFGLNDQVKRNQAGVDLFGTMWEDLGEEAIKSLMNVNGEISVTKDALDEINEIKYDDLGSAFEGLKRTIETDVTKPLGEELKPVVEDLISYVKKNAPEIRSTIKDVSEGVGDFVGFVVDNGDAIVSTIAGVGAGFLTWNVYSTISTVVTGIKAFKTASETATIAQLAFNGALKANPIGLVASLIGGAIVALTGYIAIMADEKSEHEEIIATIEKEAQARQEVIDRQQEAIDAGVGEMNHVQDLNNELKTLVDANGQVKEGYENRVRFIVNELNDALGLELELSNNQIKGYQDLSKSIDDMIQKRKAEIILDAQLPAYKEAVTKSIEAQTKANQLSAEITELEMQTKAKQAELEEKYGADWFKLSIQKGDRLVTEWGILSSDTQKKKDEYDKQNNIVKSYYNDIAVYESNATLLASGNAEDLKKIEQSVVTAKAQSNDERIKLLEEAQKAEEAHLEWMLSEYKKGNQNVSEEMIKAQQNKIQITKDELEGMRSTVIQKEPGLITAYKNSIANTVKVLKEQDPKFKEVGASYTDNIAKGTESKKAQMKKSAEIVSQEMTQTLKNQRASFESSGSYVADGINTGISSKKGTLNNTIASIGASMLERFKNTLQINSPSKAFAFISGSIPEGIAKGIDDNEDMVMDSMSNLTDDMMRSFDGPQLERQISSSISLDGVSANVTASQAVLASRFNAMIDIMSQYLPEIAKNSSKALMLDTGALIGELTPGIDDHLGYMAELKKRGG